MKFTKWLKNMLDADSSVSSKRFCGVLGWLVCLGVLVYCTILTVEAPTITEFFLLSVVGLLGVDSVTGIWKKPSKRIDQIGKNDENEYNVDE